MTAEELVAEIDHIAREYDQYDYGLPAFGQHGGILAAVRAALAAAERRGAAAVLLDAEQFAAGYGLVTEFRAWLKARDYDIRALGGGGQP